MEKIALGRPGKVLVLDHCARCGGIWFERGEAQQLTWHAPAELWKLVPPRAHVLRPPCHGCGTPLDRDHRDCAVCGRANEIACPTCDKPTVRADAQGLTLDICGKCKGVWFDHAELRSIWKLKLDELGRRGDATRSTLADGSSLLLESMLWAPDLALLTAHTAATGIANAAGGIGDIASGAAGEAAPGFIGVVGEAAESVFETITAIVSGLFD